MEIVTASFVKSSANVADCPEPKLAEYAFIGRSNVGKSSLINMLTGHGSLAKISQTPGKTQLINHFLINEQKNPWYLVDLPGYGFAKAPKKEKEKWMRFIKEYLRKRESLMCVMVLLDSRHNQQRVDKEFMEWLAQNGIPFAMVFTKMDKLSSSQLNKSLTTYKKKMLNTWETLPESFTTSASTAFGRKELLKFIEDVNTSYEASH